MDDQGVIIALPGEKLSKARLVLPPVGTQPETGEPEDAEVVAVVEADGVAAALEVDAEGEAPRRRRRRGGRGRGRGRGHEGGVESSAEIEVAGLPQAAGDVEEEPEFVVDDESIPVQAPRPVRPAAFGSVWDSQIGVAAPAAGRVPQADEEFDDEPEIPEYLLAERRNRGGQGARGGQPLPGNRAGRGRGGSYAAAIDRERYGRGGAPSSAGGTARYGEPAGRGGASRDVQPRRDMAPRRDAPLRRDAGRPIQARPERLESRPESSEPWSEVPPELEELLKAQLAQKLVRQAETRPVASTASPSTEPTRSGSDEAAAPRARGRRRPAASPSQALSACPTRTRPRPKSRSRWLPRRPPLRPRPLDGVEWRRPPRQRPRPPRLSRPRSILCRWTDRPRSAERPGRRPWPPQCPCPTRVRTPPTARRPLPSAGRRER